MAQPAAKRDAQGQPLRTGQTALKVPSNDGGRVLRAAGKSLLMTVSGLEIEVDP